MVRSLFLPWLPWYFEKILLWRWKNQFQVDEFEVRDVDSDDLPAHEFPLRFCMVLHRCPRTKRSPVLSFVVKVVKIYKVWSMSLQNAYQASAPIPFYLSLLKNIFCQFLASPSWPMSTNRPSLSQRASCQQPGKHLGISFAGSNA